MATTEDFLSSPSAKEWGMAIKKWVKRGIIAILIIGALGAGYRALYPPTASTNASGEDKETVVVWLNKWKGCTDITCLVTTEPLTEEWSRDFPITYPYKGVARPDEGVLEIRVNHDDDWIYQVDAQGNYTINGAPLDGNNPWRGPLVKVIQIRAANPSSVGKIFILKLVRIEKRNNN